MCGIIGAITGEHVTPLLLSALHRLEYRGYDSAGVATLVNGDIHRRRAEGKLRNLDSLLDEDPLEGKIGIGHTRWATHGIPNTVNAHPHANAAVALVHNGIIENFQPLRAELMSLGHAFETETDTEVILGLIQEYLNHGMSPQGATTEMLQRVEGAFALALTQGPRMHSPTRSGDAVQMQLQGLERDENSERVVVVGWLWNESLLPSYNLPFN